MRKRALILAAQLAMMGNNEYKVKEEPEVKMVAKKTLRPEFPNLKQDGPTPKGCQNEAVEFVSLKDTTCYICMGEIVWGTLKSRLKKGNALHNRILDYVLTHSHQELRDSNNFTEIREATAEELEMHASDLAKSK